jgi:hypothetical protein
MNSTSLIHSNRGKLWPLAGVLAAAALGWWLGTLHPHPTVASVKASLSPPAPPALTTSRSQLPPAVLSWLEEIEGNKDPSVRASTAARLAARLTPEEWPLLLAHLEQFSPSLTRTVLEAVVVRRWTEADPAAAAAWGLKHHGPLAAAAAAAWVGKDPDAARIWVASLTPHQRREYYLQGEFYAALFKRDPDACFALMLAHERDSEFSIGWAEPTIVRAAPEKALAFAAQLSSDKLRGAIRTAVARELGRRDPSAAIAWAKQQPDVEKMLPAVFQQSKTSPPAGMISAFAQLTPEQQKQVGSKSWAWWERGDPFVTLQALRTPPEGLTNESRQYMVARAVQVLVRHYDLPECVHRLETEWSDFAGSWEWMVASKWSARDPEAARSWIEHLPDGPARDKSLKAYDEARKAKMQQEKRPDPVETLVRVVSRPPARLPNTSSGFLSNYTSGLLNQLDETGRRQAWDQTSALPETERAQAQAKLLSIQAANSPAEAAAWLSSQSDSSTNPEFASRLAANWALDDAPAAARWVASLSEGEAKTWALWNLARQWQRVDPTAARRWANDQPAAARAVMERSFAGQRPDS